MAATPHELNYKGFIDADFINIRLDGVLYENIPKVADEEHGQNRYGDPLGELQFQLISYTDGTNYFQRRDNVYSGHTIEVLLVVGKSVVETTPCFEKAVKSVVGDSDSAVVLNNVNGTLDKTFSEVWELSNHGKAPVFIAAEEISRGGEITYTMMLVVAILPNLESSGGMLITHHPMTLNVMRFHASSGDAYPTFQE